MKKPHHTEKRGGQWWYRRRVPAELVPFVGRAEFRESLKTADIEVARIRAAFKDAAVAIEFERARGQLRQQTNMPALPEELSPEERRYISDAVRAHVLDEDESVRLARPDPDSMDAYESIRADQFDDALAALRSGRVAVGRHEKEHVVKLLEAIGLSVSPASPAWGVAAFKATEGLNQALRDIGQRMTGNFIPTPAPPTVPSGLLPRLVAVPQQEPADVSLGDVIDHYLLIHQHN